MYNIKSNFARKVKGNLRNLQQYKELSLEKTLYFCVQSGHAERSRGLEFIYKRYYGYLFAISLRYLKSREDAEEVVNESFVKAFAKLHTFIGKGTEEVFEKQFKAWLAKISVHTSIDFLRAKKTMRSLDEDESTIELPQVQAENDLEVQDIFKMIFKLPDIQRTIFNMYEVEGYSHEEIATVLDIPESTSRTYLTRAKQRLRKLYSSHEH